MDQTVQAILSDDRPVYLVCGKTVWAAPLREVQVTAGASYSGCHNEHLTESQVKDPQSQEAFGICEASTAFGSPWASASSATTVSIQTDLQGQRALWLSEPSVNEAIEKLIVRLLLWSGVIALFRQVCKHARSLTAPPVTRTIASCLGYPRLAIPTCRVSIHNVRVATKAPVTKKLTKASHD